MGMEILAHKWAWPSRARGRSVGSWRPMSYGVTGSGTDGPGVLKGGPGPWARWGEAPGVAGPLKPSRALKALTAIKYHTLFLLMSNWSSQMCQV